MTKAETKAALDACIKACYFGATKRHRIIYVLMHDAGMDLNGACEFLNIALDAKLMQVHVKAMDPWVSVTPFMIGIAANFDELAAEVW